MIDQLRSMAIFQAVAELGSFRAAAKKLGLSPSVVSHHVSQLEDQLGLPLLYRSTRRISLTDAGADLLGSAQQMTRAAQDGLSAMTRRMTEPTGALTVTLVAGLANPPYLKLLVGFASRYPKVRLALNFTDAHVKLEGSKFDLALRGSSAGLGDSSYRARPLGSVSLCLFASPAYAAARPVPRTLDDLADWDRVDYLPVPWKRLMTGPDGVAPTAEPRVVASADNFLMARAFVEAGMGVMVETVPLVIEDIRKGLLVRVLPDLVLKPVETYAIYPANAPRDSLAHLFVDYVLQQDWLADIGWTLPR